MARADLVNKLPKWWKPPVKGRIGGCLNCGPRPDSLPMDVHIAVGFGDASLYRDGERVVGEEPNQDYAETPTVADAERIAEAAPDHDWQIRLHAPLSDRDYQRHGPGLWVLIRQGMGFA